MGNAGHRGETGSGPAERFGTDAVFSCAGRTATRCWRRVNQTITTAPVPVQIVAVRSGESFMPVTLMVQSDKTSSWLIPALPANSLS